MTSPSLYRYLDYRAWLRDWFDARKRANPRFSHRAFVRRTGQKSPSLLADVIGRRRNLTPELVDSFTSALKLDREGARFFADLVTLDQAADPDERTRAWERISAHRRFAEARKVEGDSYRYLARWYYPAIRELASRPDFSADPAWIAGQLQPPITTAKAREALQELVNLGMLSPDSNGGLRQSEGAVVTPHEVLGLAVDAYHRGMLGLATDGIRAFKSTERHYTALTVCVPESLLPTLKRELGAFAERLLELCDGAEGHPERVLQINLNVFPLSKSCPTEETP